MIKRSLNNYAKIQIFQNLSFLVEFYISFKLSEMNYEERLKGLERSGHIT